MSPSRLPLERGRPRPAALAGQWYPAHPDALRDSVRAWIDAASPPPLPAGRLVGVISPHAGHVYCGPVAGYAFATVRAAAAREAPTRAVIVGPAHRVGFRGISAGDFTNYTIPTGRFPVDRDAIAALERDGLVGCLPEAHAAEHCLEILLPFLREAVGVLPLLPLLVGSASAAEVTRALAAAWRPGDMLIISSDLSHFHPYDDARARDLETLRAIVGDDAHDADRLDGHDACGVRGIQGALGLGATAGWARTLLAYQSSGDTAGDKDSVVGYGAVAFTAP